MVDTKTPADKTLSVPSKTLSLKPRVETGTVRQSFSHGRTKQVVVEKRGKRRIGGDAPATETHAPEPVAAKIRDFEERRLAEEEARRRSSREGIEQAEREAAEARRKAEEDRHRQEEEAKRKAELEAKKRFGEAEARTATTAASATARPTTRPTASAVPPARAPGVASDGSDDDEGPRQV